MEMPIIVEKKEEKKVERRSPGCCCGVGGVEGVAMLQLGS